MSTVEAGVDITADPTRSRCRNGPASQRVHQSETAEQLNRQGLISGWGKRFNSRMVTRIRLSHKLPSHHDRLRARGMLTQDELAGRLDVMPTTVKTWRRAGLLVAHRYNDKGGYLFEPPSADAPVKFQHQGKTRGRRSAT